MFKLVIKFARDAKTERYASGLCRGNKKALLCEMSTFSPELEENFVRIDSPAAAFDLCVIVTFNVRLEVLTTLLRKPGPITGKLSISAICYDLHARQLQRTPMRREKLRLRKPLKIQRMLSAWSVKIDGSSMSLMGIRES